jgi:DNA-binding CsgD family transcriptional regulator
MKICRFCLILTITSLVIQNASAQSKVEGHLILDTSAWSPVVYLSLIPYFDQMNTMTNEMIIDQTSIDKSGYFTFSTQYLPKEDHLFRIHISKWNDPPATLSIGGKDENHLFFIANRYSGILIQDTSSADIFKSIILDGNPANTEFQEINQIESYIDSIGFTASTIKTDLIRNEVNEKLRYFADTCSNPLIALYAVYKSQFEINYSVNQQYFSRFLRKWKSEKSTYFIEFRKNIPYQRKRFILIFISLSCVFFIFGFIARSIIKQRKERNKNYIKDLTNQERKVFALIMEGKSNKEISDILIIELATVKTHVNNIYSKLGINSRKDILNLNPDNKINGT